MQFLLLLPELPHSHDDGLLDHGVNDRRSSAIRYGRTLILSAADAFRRRLGVGHSRSNQINPRLS